MNTIDKSRAALAAAYRNGGAPERERARRRMLGDSFRSKEALAEAISEELERQMELESQLTMAMVFFETMETEEL